MKIKIFLSVLCLLVNSAGFAYEINGNTVTQTPNGGIRIELANPMRLDMDKSIGSARAEWEAFTIQPGSLLTRDKVPPIGWEIISNPNNLNLSVYLTDMADKIHRNLLLEKEHKSGQMSVNVKIQKNGAITDLKVVKSTYDKEQEEKILNAIRAAKGEMFLDMPSFKPIEVCFTFINFEQVDPDVAEPDFGPYMRELQRRIKAAWNPPKDSYTKRITVLMRIAKGGSLEACKVFQSSGNPKADKAAMDAVYSVAPFKPLPADYKGKSVDIQFTFDYNVFLPSR